MIPIDATITSFKKDMSDDMLIGIELEIRKGLSRGFYTMGTAESLRSFWGITDAIIKKVDEMMK